VQEVEKCDCNSWDHQHRASFGVDEKAEVRPSPALGTQRADTPFEIVERHLEEGARHETWVSWIDQEQDTTHSRRLRS